MTDRRPLVVLYNPRADFHTLPLALMALARHLDTSWVRVQIIDGRLEADGHTSVVEACRGALCLGVSVLTGSPLHDAMAATRAVRAANPRLPIIWGGWHPSLYPDDTLCDAALSAVVQGQGEVPFAAIVEALIDRRAPSTWPEIPGATTWTAEGVVRSTPAAPPADLARFRPLDYDAIPLERYFARKRQRQLDYVTSQGCRFRCGFCADPAVFGRSWTGLPAEQVADELAPLARRHDVHDVAFQDETFFTNVPRVAAIAEGLRRHDTRFGWMATMRADQGARLPIDVLRACRRAGLRRVMVGLESGSQAMLDWMVKDATVEQAFETADKCRAAGIAMLCNLIVGFPGEPTDSVRDTLRAARRLRAYGPEFQVAVFYYRPYPGTPITNAAAAEGFALPTTLEAWADIDTLPPPWSDPAMRRMVDRFVFYQRIGWARSSPLRAPVQALARWRCRHDCYAWPVEQRVLSAVRAFSPQG